MLISGHVCGAKIDVVPRPSDTGFLYSLYINPEEDLNAFDTIDLAVEPVGTAFLNYSPTGIVGFLPLSPNDESTFTNALLPCTTCYGFPGFDVLDGSQQAPGRLSSEHGIFRSIASREGTLASAFRYHVINILVQPRSTFHVGALFLRSGDVVDRYNVTVVSAPEPSAALLAACSLLLTGLNRRRS